jgi:hypothetical protein
MVLRAAGLVLVVCLLGPAQSSPTPVVSLGTPMSASGPGDAGSVQPDTPPPPAACPAGGPIGPVELTVRPPEKNAAPLPFRTINHLTEGDVVLYSPVLHHKEKRSGEVSLVMVPQKRDPAGDDLIVTEPKPADKPQQWTVDQTIAVAAFVYGPEGLSRKKVRGFLSQDDLLIAQLADYAEKTAETEALIETLSNAESSSASVNAALNGFAAQYGVAAPIDRTAPPAVQAQTLFSTMNPQLASYDPLAPAAGSRIAQTAGLTTVAATLFFGSPIGLAAGGTAMLLDLRAIAFPGIQFRSSFAVPIKEGLNLCGQRNAPPPHTRVAYIWANRIPNAPAPVLAIQHANNIPAGQKTPVPADAPPIDWKYLDRARDWTLQGENGQKSAVKVVKLANQKALEVDLTKTALTPGDYHLAGYWDWTAFNVKGDIHVRPLSDFNHSRLEASSQDRLLAKGEKTVVTLEDSDFEFTSKVEIKKDNDEFAAPQPVPFLLPKGLREGPQNHMDLQIDTASLEPGDYRLLISQPDGKSHPVPVRLLPNPPKIENLPIVANQGAGAQHYVLKGERLQLLTTLEGEGASLQLDPATADGSQRGVTIRLTATMKPDTEQTVRAFVENRSEPLLLNDALKITGPLPLIASTKISLPNGLAVAVNPGEIPAGQTLSAVLDVKNIEPKSELRLSCAQDVGPKVELHVGEQTDHWSLQQLSPDQLFVSYDTAPLPAGCSLEATIDNGFAGHSEPYPVARVVRLPQIDQFALEAEQAPDGKHQYVLNGRNLETIGEVGWDQMTGFEVNDMPTPIPGQGQKQSLKVALPDPPAPNSALYVWLRGEKTGRSTNVTSTAGLPGASRPAAAPAVPAADLQKPALPESPVPPVQK